MVRNVWFVLIAIAVLAACSRSQDPPPQEVIELGDPPSRPSEPRVQEPEPEPEAEPEVRKTEGGYQAEKRSMPLPNGYSRELKLLYIEQSFRHEARFLNENLKRDKGLLYQGFFFDAQDGWTQPTSSWSDDAKKRVKPLLCPFFADGKIVREQQDFLDLGFDVLILGDIDWTSNFWRKEYWDWLNAWVTGGGGLILLSGQGHHPTNYVNVDGYKALCPLNLDFAPDADQLVDRSRPKYFGLTEAGHELFRLNSDEGRNAELWGSEVDGKFARGELHGLYWHAIAGERKADATVLARVVRQDGKVADGTPLVVTRDHGKGRVLWLGTDDAHYWRQWVGEYYFYRFWQNAIRWVARDPGK